MLHANGVRFSFEIIFAFNLNLMCTILREFIRKKCSDLWMKRNQTVCAKAHTNSFAISIGHRTPCLMNTQKQCTFFTSSSERIVGGIKALRRWSIGRLCLANRKWCTICVCAQGARNAAHFNLMRRKPKKNATSNMYSYLTLHYCRRWSYLAQRKEINNN